MRVESYLDDRGVSYRKVLHPMTMTAQGLASAMHVSGKMVAKPVLVSVDGENVMCVVPANLHVNLDQVAQLMEGEDVRLLTEDELEEICRDCELGAEVPIGQLYDLPTIMDAHLEDYDQVLFQAGNHLEAIRMRMSDFEAIADPIVGYIAYDPCLC
jgi:Ala-tRNA(Pro) deacylase